MHAFWKEERQPGARDGSVPCSSYGYVRWSRRCSARGTRRWDCHHASRAVGIFKFAASSAPGRVPATHLSACDLGPSRLQSRTSASTALCGCARTTKVGLAAGSPSCPAWLAFELPWSPTCTPPTEFLKKSPPRSHEKALGSDKHSGRPTDKLQILSWNPGPARGSDQRALADRLNGPWHIICIQEAAGFVTSSSLAEKFSPPSTPAPFSSTRTPLRGTSRAHRCTFRVRTHTPHGRLKAWWSLASSAELPSRRVRISRSPTFKSIVNAPKGDPCASRCC